jgi:hypothetical protein
LIGGLEDWGIGGFEDLKIWRLVDWKIWDLKFWICLVRQLADGIWNLNFY